MKNIIVIATLMLLCAASCKKDKASEDQLPPATQTGANTFGCLVNGKVFVSKGYDGTSRPNPYLQYDIGFDGKPYFNIKATHFSNNNYVGEIFIAFGSVMSTGNYPVPDYFNFSVGWFNTIGDCGTMTFDTTLKKWGGGLITTLDIPNRIISGTFDFKYKTMRCDTVRITNGRFDIKF